MKKIKLYLTLTLTLLISCLPINVSAKTKSTTPIKLNPRVSNFHSNYSGKMHKITFSGRTNDVFNLKIKYDNQVVKNLKVNQNVAKFKVTIPFKGYETFKIYGDKKLLKTVSPKKYVTNKPILSKVKRNNSSVYIEFYTRPGNIIKIWENGKPVYSTTSDISKDNIFLESKNFHNYDNLRITQHKRGQKTSKMLTLPKLKIGEVYRRIK